MNRLLTVAVIVAVLAGSVPAAATLADGTPSDSEPGAAFSGMVGVQEAEVNNEVADRSLTHRLRSAETNESKASVVAGESEQLQERLAELEAQKEQLKRAYENGSISKGQYQARLAILGAELRAVERQANQTADVAEKLPEEALREKGANATEVRAIAQQANRTGGGEVAEAARNIAGESVGNGLGNPPNASERGPPADVGNGAPTGTEGNTTERKPTDVGPPSDTGNESDVPGKNGTNRGEGNNNTSATGSDGVGPNTATDWNDTEPRNNDGDAANRSTGAKNESSRSATPGNGSAAANRSDQSANGTANESAGENGQNSIEFGTPADWLSGDVSVDGVLSRLEGALPGLKSATVPRTTLG